MNIPDKRLDKVVVVDDDARIRDLLRRYVATLDADGEMAGRFDPN